MKNLKYFIIVYVLFLSVHFIYSQNVTFYMRIEDKNLIPVPTPQVKDMENIEIKTKNEEFNLLLSKYQVKKFNQAFPTAKSDWLQKVFIVESEELLLNELKKDKFHEKITHIELLCEPSLCYTPNDYSLEVNQTNLDLIKAKGAWDILGNLPRLPIGVTDIYFDTNHEDLKNQFLGTVANNTSVNFHGTAVAGLLGAQTDNAKGISSISFNAKMYVSTNWGSDNQVLLLAQQGYRIINCSWLNGCSFSAIQDNLYREIRDVWNTVVVFGAGNNTGHCDSLSAKVYPASLSSVLSVTSVGHIYPVGTMTPYGSAEWIDCHEEVVGNPTTAHHHNDAVDICAPGFNVPSTMNGNQYSGAWGTSFAAPQVAAAVCLILSINPCLSAEQAMNVVKNTADASIYSIPYNASYIGLLGTGRLDVTAACLSAAQTATKTYNLPTTLSGNKIVETNYAIKTIAPVKILSGSNVLFKTRKEVELGPGFEVEAGATFEINVNSNHIINCN